MKNSQKLLLGTTCALVAGSAFASSDYGPAYWRPPCNANYYTSGYGKKFFVVHDMEGYYWSSINMLNGCGWTASSVHYLTNGKTDNSSDAAPGEVTQSVADANYAWHATCWNRYSMGCEHEGFASNPAWFTDAQYRASASLVASKAGKYGFAKDRNHVVAHGQKSNAAWCSYAEATFGIDAHCNTHTDPGPNWNWTLYMGYINGGVSKTAVIKDNTAATFTGTWATGSSSTDKYGADYRYHSTAAVSEPATWTTGLNTSASWNVRAWWPQGGNRSTTAPYIVTHAGGTATVNKNQQTGGGAWQLLGTWSMSTGKVQLSCWTGTGYVVVADAIKWD